MEDLKILVVDDSSAMRRILANTLGKLGYADTGAAENGAEAMKMLETGDFNFVFTDWNMPVMDGLTLVKNIRSTEAIKSIPIIMVTTEAAKDDIMDAIKAGVSNYVVKPFTVDTIKEKLEATLQRIGS